MLGLVFTMEVLKNIFKSTIFRLVISITLIYFAFKKVDVVSLVEELRKIDLWFVMVNILVGLFFTALISYRWSLLLLEKSRLKDVFNFTKSTLTASFYGLFLPTVVGVDVLKWLVINEKYPKLSKSKLLGSVFLDRFIALSVYMFVGLISIFIAKSKGFMVPDLVLFLVLGVVVFCLLFYIGVAFFNLERLFKIKFLKRFSKIADLIKKEGLKRIVRGMFISMLSETGWILHLWFISWYFGTNLTVFHLLIFMPVISLILILPISIAGFGAREQLYLFFFSQVGASKEKLLLMSAFTGILAIIISLIGGLITVSSDFRRLKKKV
jgi:glycosyltransferase 2 family protein